jgi:hypothetical protein
VYGGLNRLLASAFVASAVAVGAALIAAPAALACSGGPSAYNVYHECLSNGGSGGGGGGNKGGGSGGSGNTTPTGGSQSTSTATPPPVSPKVKKAIAHAGKDGDALKSLYKAGGGTRFLSATHTSTPASEPTAIGSAFDLGSGPTALLIALAGTAVLLLALTGVRGARRRR